MINFRLKKSHMLIVAHGTLVTSLVKQAEKMFIFLGKKTEGNVSYVRIE